MAKDKPKRETRKPKKKAAKPAPGSTNTPPAFGPGSNAGK
jgi:hypothetical protein